ncbi:MAG: hypothetical protein FJX44_06960 [Alphaproteobacteria bacterium]|nr:hypothetical protein [Alphaproteobacteria bacterium]
MKWFWEHVEPLGALMMSLAALAALIYAHVQITEGREAERRANVHELWREILRLGFENPVLSDPTQELGVFDYDARTVDGSRQMFQKYELFVDTVLNASDEILEVQSTPQWITTVRLELNQHREYLLSPHFQNSGFIKQYTPQFRTFIFDALKDRAK